MAHSDRAAVHVPPVVRYPEPVTAISHLDHKSLVVLPWVDVVDAQPQAVERPGNGEHRAVAHLVRLTSQAGKAAVEGERIDPAALDLRRVHDNAGGGPIRSSAGVAGGEHPAVDDRTQ
jgi:hypothetical protein